MFRRVLAFSAAVALSLLPAAPAGAVDGPAKPANPLLPLVRQPACIEGSITAGTVEAGQNRLRIDGTARPCGADEIDARYAIAFFTDASAHIEGGWALDTYPAQTSFHHHLSTNVTALCLAKSETWGPVNRQRSANVDCALVEWTTPGTVTLVPITTGDPRVIRVIPQPFGHKPNPICGSCL
jgi:hypothetical protein